MKVTSISKIIKSSDQVYDFEDIDNVVKKIIEEVRKNGDIAVKKYTKKFDGINISNFEIGKNDVKRAYDLVDKKTVNLIKKAGINIEFFAKKQKEIYKDFEVNKNGLILGQKVIPIESVGCYVPGGRYPLVSSVLMTVIPAKVAGVKNIVVCSPNICPEIIIAADLTGANRIFNLGGVQAIAAMAFGTKSVPKVDKIVGPGNNYVTAAKKYVYGTVGIDFIAGPSELLVIADESSNVEYIASDLLGQMEHDPNAKTYLVTTSKKIADGVTKEIKSQIKKLKTEVVAEQSLKNGKIIFVSNLNEAVKVSNKIAPEHLEIQIKKPNAIITKLNNYGSLFIGMNSAEVFGDYCSGTNHVLPTNGAAKYSGGLSVGNFLKIVTYQKICDKKLNEMIEVASKIAEIEGLDAHKKSAEIRRKTQKIYLKGIKNFCLPCPLTYNIEE